MSDYLCEWQPSERDIRLHDLATRYHTECEAYERTVCTGPVLRGVIMPATTHEMVLSNRNAYAVRKKLTEEAAREGIGSDELAREIIKWNGVVHNAKAVGLDAAGGS